MLLMASFEMTLSAVSTTSWLLSDSSCFAGLHASCMACIKGCVASHCCSDGAALSLWQSLCCQLKMCQHPGHELHKFERSDA